MGIIDILKFNLNSRPFMLRFIAYYYNCIALNAKLLFDIIRFRFPINKRFDLFIKRPKTLQFPITNNCNLNCKMCGIKNVPKIVALSPEQFSEIFKNKIFKYIRSVGISGGEPFLQKDLFGYIGAMISSLPNLKNVYIISNGTLTSKILTDLPRIKLLCSSNNVLFMFSISIDGVGDTHNFIRGREGTFAEVQKTCKFIMEDINNYCDGFGILCTITKYNIYNINELDVWAKYNRINISYNIATQHVRLNTVSLQDDFTVFSNEHTRLMTAEFFYGKFIENKSPFYFALYKFVAESERATGCAFKYDGITILADGSISYCATNSKVLGNALIDGADYLYNRDKPYRKELIDELCHKCSHYTSALLFNKNLEYNKEILKNIGPPFKFR